MFSDLNVPWTPDSPDLVRTAALLDERRPLPEFLLSRLC